MRILPKFFPESGVSTSLTNSSSCCCVSSSSKEEVATKEEDLSTAVMYHDASMISPACSRYPGVGGAIHPFLLLLHILTHIFGQLLDSTCKMQLRHQNRPLLGVFFFLNLTAAIAHSSASLTHCAFLTQAPIIEYDLPSYQYKLKFLDVDAKVYRTTLTTGATPRIRILKYSAKPVIDHDDDTQEILISTEASSCISSSSSEGSKIFARPLISSFMTALAVAVTGTQFGFSGGWTAGGALLGASALLAFHNGPSFASAADACTPALEIVVEAPPYYLGSVDSCLAEVENPDHCPLPFPTYEECSDPTPTCKIAVIGAGTGGLYTAMRLVEEGKVAGSDVCIFEATDRVGGRLYSLRGFGPENDISVDAGGYRSWPQYTPVLHALITEKLGFKVDCYDKTEDCQRYNIVGDTGEKIGFASFVEKMMEILIGEGACYYSRHTLVSIETDVTSGTVNTLYFSNGVVATATEDVILNVPQRPLLEILRKSKIPMTEDQEQLIYDSMHSVQTEIASKLYLYYSDAWWPKLGLLNGDFSKPGDARNMLLAGRYHDGHIKCDSNGNNCYGFLLAVYTHDFGGNKAQFFRRYQKDRPEPVTVISNTDVEGRAFLKHAHDRLVEYHLYDAQNRTYTGFEANRVFSAASPPEFAVLSTWNIATFGAGGAWHGWTDLSNVQDAMFPLNSFHIHVINEAFSTLQGWAEGSLKLADEVLETYFDVSRPWSFEVSDMVQVVSQTSSEECTVDSGSGGGSSGGGGGGSGGGSGGGGDAGPDLCFTSDALVRMADGSMKRISDVTVGDHVDTGLLGTGLVTEHLKHDVNDVVKVAVISTAHGELIGTVNHPIHVNGDWYQIDDALESGLLVEKLGIMNVTIEKRFVDTFYNLEVDGNYESIGSSSHSYTVNGIIASGLGDNPILNRLYQRQKIWQQQDEKEKPVEMVDTLRAAAISS